MSTQKTITIDTIKQLIDINGDVTNFKADFTVAAPNGDSFKLVVADQNTLDGGGELQYQDVKGSLSGTVTADKNLYQNYYLVLKADRAIPVNVTINFEELPLKDLPYEPQPVPGPPAAAERQPARAAAPTKSKGGVNWKIILIIAVVLVGAFFLYKFYSEGGKEGGGAEPFGTPAKGPSPSPSPAVKSPEAPGIKPPGFTFGRTAASSKYY